MSAGAISGAASAGAEGAGGFGALSSGDFINVLLSELSNQDPFDPQDSAALLEQLSSLRNIESQLALQDQLEDLVLQNQVAAAGGLIGKVVAGLDSTNREAQGLVTSVRVQNGKAILELDSGRALAMDRVTEISELRP
jgi:flagellar basal-body rod modification protein FlgD